MKQLITSKCPIPFMKNQIRNLKQDEWVENFFNWWECLKMEGTNSVQFNSVSQSCLTLCNPMNRSTPGLPVHHQLPEFTQIHVHPVMPSSHVILCCPLLLLPPIAPSVRVFSYESTLLRVYSRVTAGMSIRNSSLFIEVRNLSRYEGQLRNVN